MIRFLPVLVFALAASHVVSLATSNVSGTWLATFTDSVSSAIYYLKLREDFDGTLVGTLENQGITSGMFKAQPDGTMFSFRLTQSAEECAASFSGRLTIDGNSGTGTYVGRDCRREHKNGVLKLSRVSSASPASAQQTRIPDGAECIVSHSEPNYVTWICDYEQNPSPTRAKIYHFRTNLAGERVASSVWKGSREDWKAHHSEVIANHQAWVKNCSAFVTVSHITGLGELRWDWPTQNMVKWYENEGSMEFPSICWTKNQWEADFVIVWSLFEGAIPDLYSIPVPESFYYSGFHQGNIYLHSRLTYGYGNYGGTATGTVTRYKGQTQTGEGPIGFVTAAVVPVGAETRVIHKSEHKGRWRWSKPDEDALEDCFKFLKNEVPKR